MVIHATRGDICARQFSRRARSILVGSSWLLLTAGGFALGLYSVAHLQAHMVQD
jgi:hypothetical protein